MAINWNMLGVGDYNARNPCCCGLPSCPQPEFDNDMRDAMDCLAGYNPYTMTYASDDEDHDEPWPSAFDSRSVGVLIPVYKNREESVRRVITGTLTCRAEQYKTGDALWRVWTYSETVSFDHLAYTQSEWGKAIEDWPGSSQALGSCAPDNAITAAPAPDGFAVSFGDPLDNGKRIVRMQWGDNRPTKAAPEGSDDPVIKIGSYDAMVDGTFPIEVTDDEHINVLEIYVDDEDTSCHTLQVRHVLTDDGVNVQHGQWSAPYFFARDGDPCCVLIPLNSAVYHMGCPTETTGNTVHNLDPAGIDAGGYSWEGNFIVESAPNPKSGTFFYCGDVANETAEAAWTMVGSPFFEGMDPHLMIRLQLSALTVETRTWDTKTKVTTWAVDEPNTQPAANPTGRGVQVTLRTEDSNGTLTETTEFTNNQNSGQSTVEGLFGNATATLSAWSDAYGWGGLINVDDWDVPTDAARAEGCYPETDGSGSMGGSIWAKVRQMRFRWRVPESFPGGKYTVTWQIGRFPDKWEAWRGEYYTWATEKWAYTIAQPGHPLYPVAPDRENFPDDESYDIAMIVYHDWTDYLATLEDPGSAPAEPAERPTIVEEEGGDPSWTWLSSQGRSPLETIGACDPTKSIRELQEPVAPDPEDFDNTEDYNDAVDAYDQAVIEYEAALEILNAATARQSPWYHVTPDRVSDYRKKPYPPAPLPSSPTPSQIEAHTQATAIYNNRLTRYNSGRHECYRVCNVRYSCGDTPVGEIQNYDPTWRSTTLPPLHPTEIDPIRWAAWYE